MSTDSIILTFIFITHLFLFNWAVIVYPYTSYLVNNVFLYISLLWSIHQTNCSAPPLVALLINVMSIVLDAIFIGILWYDGRGYKYVLGVLAYFVNLLYRLITSLIIYQIWIKRRQNESNNENIGSVTRDLTKYLMFGGSRVTNTTRVTTTTTTTSGPPPNSGVNLP